MADDVSAVRHDGPESVWLGWLPVAAVVVLGTAITLALFGFQRELQAERQGALLEREARTLTDAIDDRLKLVDDRLGSVRSLLAAAGATEAEQYSSFVQSLMSQRLAVETIAWLPRVGDAERARFETAGPVIRERSGDGLRPAERRAEYFPVRFMEPFVASAPALGRDLGSEPRWREALERARDAAQPVCVDLGLPGTEGSLLVLVPVFPASAAIDTVDERRAALRGVVLGMVRLDPLVRIAAVSGLERFAIRLRAVQGADLGARIAIGDAALLDMADRQEVRGAYRTRVGFGGRDFELLAVPSRSAFERGTGIEATLILAFGLLATAGLGVVAYLLQSGNRRVVQLVEARTSALRASEGALQLSRERLQLALQSARMWAWDWDVASDALIWLDNPEPMLGPRPPDGWPDFRTRVHADDYEAFLAAGRACLQTGAPYRCEFRIRRTDGAEAWLLASGAVIRDGSGKPLRMIGVSLDVTARKEAEARLREALLAAEQASRTKSDFLATMSHEIRTPMNGVLGMAELLKLTALDEEQAGYVRVLQESGNSLLTLLNDILDYSKLESGRLDLVPAPFAPAELIFEVKQLMSGRAREKGIVLDADIAGGVAPEVLGDSVRLRQVLANLVGNAVKFTERGAVSVRIAPAPTGDIRFEVRDTGIGVPADALARLFQPFTQVDASITRRFGGSGLGLAICKRLVEAMGGHLGVESTEGAGSCFWFEVPLPATDAAAVAAVAVHESDGPPAWPGRCVLVVEDNAVNAAVVSRLLEKRGIEVCLAADGMAGVERAAMQDIDLILMDIQMPVLDGLSATRRIRSAEPPERHVPIIALTANAFDEDRLAANAAGMDDFLAKPLQARELDRVLGRWLAG